MVGQLWPQEEKKEVHRKINYYMLQRDGLCLLCREGCGRRTLPSLRTCGPVLLLGVRSKSHNYRRAGKGDNTLFVGILTQQENIMFKIFK
jgi:hypothetical protein